MDFFDKGRNLSNKRDKSVMLLCAKVLSKDEFFFSFYGKSQSKGTENCER
ncbi:hypothetical protein YC2023_001610 [Brassica napus]